MNMNQSQSNRRAFLGTLALGASFFTTRGAFADELTRTPTTNEGPFFPNKLPLDTDNDLLIINDKITPAVGEITHLGGRLLDATGSPLRKGHETLCLDFNPLKGSKIGELAVNWDIVLGYTPEA